MHVKAGFKHYCKLNLAGVMTIYLAAASEHSLEARAQGVLQLTCCKIRVDGERLKAVFHSCCAC